MQRLLHHSKHGTYQCSTEAFDYVWDKVHNPPPGPGIKTAAWSVDELQELLLAHSGNEIDFRDVDNLVALVIICAEVHAFTGTPDTPDTLDVRPSAW